MPARSGTTGENRFMTTLYLLRHAKSSRDDAAIADFDRPLNARGRAAATLVAGLLRTRGIRPPLVLCSPARRTRETCAALAESLAGAELCFDGELYAAHRDRLLARLRRCPGGCATVMVIGHNPGLEDLARLLTGPADGAAAAAMRQKFPTAALAVLDCPAWSELGPGRCTLREFIRPVDLES